MEHTNSLDTRKFKWDALQERVTGLINQVSISSIQLVAREILNENLIAGRGLFCNAIMQSQMASLQFSNVFAALVAVVNSKFPDVGYLLVKRVVLQFKQGYDCKDKLKLLGALNFLAHLVNQEVVNKVIAMDVLIFLMGKRDDFSIEVAVCFCIECGSLLQDLCPHGLNSVFEELSAILHEGIINRHVQRMVEDLFTMRSVTFKDHPAIIDELVLVEFGEQVTHLVSLLHDIDPETSVDVFRPDVILEENKNHYEDATDLFVDQDNISSLVSSRIEYDDSNSSNSDDERNFNVEYEVHELMY